MSGASIAIKRKDLEARRYLMNVWQRLDNPLPAMKAIGQLIRTSVIRNFEQGGRPTRWAPVKSRSGGKVLMRRGFGGGLAGSISPSATRSEARVGTNKVYAAVHQFGIDDTVQVPAHRRKVKSRDLRSKRKKTAFGVAFVRAHSRKMLIPARPYLMIQDEDWPEIRATLQDYVI